MQIKAVVQTINKQPLFEYQATFVPPMGTCLVHNGELYEVWMAHLHLKKSVAEMTGDTLVGPAVPTVEDHVQLFVFPRGKEDRLPKTQPM